MKRLWRAASSLLPMAGIAIGLGAIGWTVFGDRPPLFAVLGVALGLALVAAGDACAQKHGDISGWGDDGHGRGGCGSTGG
ncbi:hypothetical protein GCM10020367_52670 [Streptomyces sannanensis]|uniref:Uncharacterized protein n=1 Tax=Streptomyces sannanensis TaxID=285536 RepID=A0ABP6SJB2_9ACTN